MSFRSTLPVLVALGTLAQAYGWNALGHKFASAADRADTHLLRYVAPEARGDGSGTSAADAAKWTDATFWSHVGTWLDEGDVVVKFVDGTYFVSGQKELKMPRLSLSNLGHPTHRLTLQGESADGVTITRHVSDGTTSREGAGLLHLNRCQNVTLRYLHFTAPQNHWMSYATQFDRCKNLWIESCSWIDMPNVHHGATGAHRAETDNVVYRDCRFVRIGRRSGAHMAYNAYAPRRISYINCYFEDCAGDYVRFRSGADYGVVAGCTFRSTGDHTNTHMPFVSVPLFNNVDPGDEYFGTHFLIFNNAFIYESDETPDTRIAIRFFHRGFDPPNRRHLLDTEEAKVLESGRTEEKQALLKENLAVDTDTIHVYGNEYTNVEHRGVYQFDAAYGAVSRGGDGCYDIFDTFNSESVVTSPHEAAAYFGGGADPAVVGIEATER